MAAPWTGKTPPSSATSLAWTVGTLSPFVGLPGAGLLCRGAWWRGALTCAAGLACVGLFLWAVSGGNINALGDPSPAEEAAAWAGIVGYPLVAVWSVWDLSRQTRSIG